MGFILNWNPTERVEFPSDRVPWFAKGQMSLFFKKEKSKTRCDNISELTIGLELDEDLFVKTVHNWQQVWNLMKIYLLLNKAKSRCENNSELTKGLELDEDLFVVEML